MLSRRVAAARRQRTIGPLIRWDKIDHPAFHHYNVVISAVIGLTDSVYEGTTRYTYIPVPDIPAGTYYIGIQACDEIEEICGDWSVQQVTIGDVPSVPVAAIAMRDGGYLLDRSDNYILARAA